MDSLVAGLDLTGLGPPDEEGRFDTEPDRMYDSRDMVGGRGRKKHLQRERLGYVQAQFWQTAGKVKKHELFSTHKMKKQNAYS